MRSIGRLHAAAGCSISAAAPSSEDAEPLTDGVHCQSESVPCGWVVRRCVFSMDMRGRWPGSSTSAGALRNPPDSSWAGPLGVDLDGILRGRGSKRCETHTVFRPYNGHSRMSSNESSVMSLVV